jgi:16S rRNA (cytosine1402-N4)-methyltransferase
LRGTSEGAEHIPVLYEEVLAGLQVRPGGCYADATVGAGGHAAGILRASAPDGRLLGLDADPEAIAHVREVLHPFGDRVRLQAANFRRLQAVAVGLGFAKVDGILLDLGLSSRQLADADRGFSFSQDGPLDMRMDRTHGQTAADLVNHLSEAALADLLWQYGEERYARRIARAILGARPLVTTGQLADMVARTIHRESRKERQRRKGRTQRRPERIHPATRTFQALRIAVNDELESLVEVLPQARDLLQPGGRLAVISFHSLEDRLVKGFFRREARDCVCPPESPICTCHHRATLQIISRKPIRPGPEEIDRNPRSRSARLRNAELRRSP